MVRTGWDSAWRFAVNGVAATATHAGCLWLWLSFGLPPAVANGLAFLCAVCVTYAGQRWWVFRREAVSLWRFLGVVLAGFVVQSGGMALWTLAGGAVWWGWLLLTIAVPVLSFVAMRAWVFCAQSLEGAK